PDRRGGGIKTGCVAVGPGEVQHATKEADPVDRRRLSTWSGGPGVEVELGTQGALGFVDRLDGHLDPRRLGVLGDARAVVEREREADVDENSRGPGGERT